MTPAEDTLAKRADLTRYKTVLNNGTCPSDGDSKKLGTQCRIATRSESCSSCQICSRGWEEVGLISCMVDKLPARWITPEAACCALLDSKICLYNKPSNGVDRGRLRARHGQRAFAKGYQDLLKNYVRPCCDTCIYRYRQHHLKVFVRREKRAQQAQGSDIISFARGQAHRSCSLSELPLLHVPASADSWCPSPAVVIWHAQQTRSIR